MNDMPISEVKRMLAEPNGSEKLMGRAVAALPAAWELFCAGYAPAGSFLYRCAKRRGMRDYMNEKLGDERAAIKNALASDDAKLRKNAARLSGALEDERDVAFIVAAMNKETVRMVMPSYLLALGALGGEEAVAALHAHRVAPAKTESEQKHFAEESDALSQALLSVTNIEKHEFTGLPGIYEMELRTADHMADMLCDELFSLKIDAHAVSHNAVRVRTRDVDSLYFARCFSEMLFPIARGVTASPEAISHNGKAFLLELLHGSCPGASRYGFRIEVKGENVDRAALIKETAKLMTDDVLVNSPGDYEAELRVEINRHGTAELYAKLYTIKDKRFDYRKGAIPASINPATAAAIMRFALPYLKEGARVLDPCCGSGTMLVERGKILPCASLTGVDIAHKTVDIARENASYAVASAKFIVNDCLRFEANRRYDEVISNLPFGNRVGNHETNERLYDGILKKLPEWVNKGGVAILYTMEFTLMKKLVSAQRGLTLIGETRTSAGGLNPGIFVIRVGEGKKPAQVQP